MENEDYLDEKIIAMINQVEQPVPVETGIVEKNPEERTIYSGIKVTGKWIEFERRSFVAGKITMMVPKEFEIMEPEKAKIKYPAEQRPTTILTDHTGAVNILFNYMGEDRVEGEMDAYRSRTFGMMCRINPGIKLQSMGTELISGQKVAYVEFTNPVIDGKLYNLMYFLAVENRILMVSFNCRTKTVKYWKQPAFEMMCSTEVMNKEENRQGGTEKSEGKYKE